MFIHYFAKFRTPSDTTLYNEIGVFDSLSISKEFTSKFTEIESIVIFNNFTDSTIHAQIEFTFTKFDSINSVPALKGANFRVEAGPSATKIFSQFISPFFTPFGVEKTELNLKYIYYLPGKILSHNANSISNNKLEWNFNLEDIGRGKLITATYKPWKLKETPTWIYILCLLVLITVTVYLFSKKK